MFERQHRRQLTGVEKLINTPQLQSAHFQRNHCRLHHDANILQCTTPGRSTGEAQSAVKSGPLEIETIEPAPSGQPTTRWVPAGVCGSWPLLAVWDPRFSWAHRQPNTCWVPPGVCGSWSLLAVWDPRFSWVHRQPTHAGSLLECAAPGRSSQCGTRGFPGLTANPQHMLGPSWSVRLLAAPRSVGPAVFLGSPPTHNTCWVPPGVCGSWPLLAVWDPRFSYPPNLLLSKCKQLSGPTEGSA